MQMKIVTLQVGRWLVGAAWLWGSGVYGQTYEDDLYDNLDFRATYPNCSVVVEGATYRGSYYIRSQAEANGLKGCSSLVADIEVLNCSPNVTSISLEDLKVLEGMLVVSWCDGLQNFSAPVLESIKTSGYYNALTFYSLPRLTSIQAPSLQVLRGGLTLGETPLLSTVVTSLKHGVSGNILIANTSLKTVDFLLSGPDNPTVNLEHTSHTTDLIINDNPVLEHITVPGTTFGNVSIYNNGLFAHAYINLPDLQSCARFFISGAISLDVPELVNVQYDLSIIESSMVSLSLPKLDKVGYDILIANNTLLESFNSSLSGQGSYPLDNNMMTISDNPLLFNINLQRLGTLGADTIISSPAASLIGLDHLYSFGVLNISGNFSSFMLPSYQITKYYNYAKLFINSTNPDFDCYYLDQGFSVVESSPIEKYYSCSAYSGMSKIDVARHWRPKKGIQQPGILAAVVVTTIAGVALLVLFAWLYRRRAQRRRAEAAAVVLADLPPTYARVPKPHEVPPVYHHGSGGSEMDSNASTVVTPMAPTENAGSENAREMERPTQDYTATRDLAPPMYVEHDRAGEPRGSSDVAQNVASHNGSTTQPARLT